MDEIKTMNNNDELQPTHSFDLKAFESELKIEFPEIAKEIEEDEGLLHLHFGSLYRFTQEKIRNNNWNEVKKVFKYLGNKYSENNFEIENAIRVSYLEYFDFVEHEEKIKGLFGPIILGIYDDQMEYQKKLFKNQENNQRNNENAT
ncbi:MAG: hypothetical protein ACHQ6U_12875 [Thermodesulfobacteriota bacterium]